MPAIAQVRAGIDGVKALSGAPVGCSWYMHGTKRLVKGQGYT